MHNWEINLHVGLDDTDSLEGGCTTYLASLLCREVKTGIKFIDYPNLVRLNPNVPFKTRGNGAVAIRVRGHIQDVMEFKEIARKLLKEYLKPNDHAQPCLVFVEDRTYPELSELYRNALIKIVNPREATRVAKTCNAEVEFFPGFSGHRGIIGALAAIGWNLSAKDYSFELISYRSRKNWKVGLRQIDPDSIFDMNQRFTGTFGNIDLLNKEIKIAPHGPDPVLCGLRGNNPEELLDAWRSLDINEPVDNIMLFRTNQCTDEHLLQSSTIAMIQPYESVVLRGIVSGSPKRKIGGHLFLKLQDNTGEIQCAAYEPTRQFRDKIELLCPGDELLVFGGIRPATKKHPMTLNLEKVRVISLVPRFKTYNPLCPKCGKRLKSAGQNKGYKCIHCLGKFPELRSKSVQLKALNLQNGEWIHPPARAWRHLTMPPSRSRQVAQLEPNLHRINHWIKKESLKLIQLSSN